MRSRPRQRNRAAVRRMSLEASAGERQFGQRLALVVADNQVVVLVGPFAAGEEIAGTAARRRHRAVGSARRRRRASSSKRRRRRPTAATCRQCRPAAVAAGAVAEAVVATAACSGCAAEAFRAGAAGQRQQAKENSVTPAIVRLRCRSRFHGRCAQTQHPRKPLPVPTTEIRKKCQLAGPRKSSFGPWRGGPGLAHRRNDEFGAFFGPGRPARGHGLGLGVEADRIRAVLIEVAEAERFQPPKV